MGRSAGARLGKLRARSARDLYTLAPGLVAPSPFEYDQWHDQSRIGESWKFDDTDEEHRVFADQGVSRGVAYSKRSRERQKAKGEPRVTFQSPRKPPIEIKPSEGTEIQAELSTPRGLGSDNNPCGVPEGSCAMPDQCCVTVDPEPLRSGISDLAAPASMRLRTMECLVAQFRRIAGENSKMSFSEFKKAADMKTEAFARRLFLAIDADANGFITCEEYVNFFYALKCQNLRSRLRILFDLYDIDSSGSLSGTELQDILTESVCESNAEMDRDLVKYLSDCIMSTFDIDGSGDISFDEFVKAMSQYPDLVQGLTVQGSCLEGFDSECSAEMGCFPYIKCVCRQFRNTMVNNPERTISLVVLLVMLASAFWWRASRYSSGPKFELMGWPLPIAKGCGQMMKVIFALVLFPISRNFMTLVRKTPLKYVFPVDDGIDFHKLLGTLGFIFAWVHSLCHVSDVWRWGDPNRFDIWRRAFPDERKQPTRLEITSSLVGITGILQLLIYTLVFVTASNWPRRTHWMRRTRFGKFLNNFNMIWYVHHLTFVFLGLMLFHPMPHIPDEKNEWGYSDVWVWIGVPIIVYVVERLLRLYRQSKCVQVLSAEILPGRVVALKLSKPKNLAYKTGMYIYINIPSIARFEWHPFSLTSPTEADHLSVHIKVCGDWTEELYDRCSRRKWVKSRCNKKELVSRLSVALAPSGDSVSMPRSGSGTSRSPLISSRASSWSSGRIARFEVAIPEGGGGLYHNEINPMLMRLPTRGKSGRLSAGPKIYDRDIKKPSNPSTSGTNPCKWFGNQGPQPPSQPHQDAAATQTQLDVQKLECRSFSTDLSHVPSPRDDIFEGERAVEPLNIKIDGPFGAPVQGFKGHSVLLLVGAGIGVTPFAGILSDLVYRIRQANGTSVSGLPRLRKVYFCWSVRSQSEVVWFSRVLEAISKDDTLGILDINIHVTGLRSTKDVRTALLKLVQVSVHVSTGVDVVSGLNSRVLTHFGRPDWESVFQRIQKDYPKETVGVFYSGPNTLAAVLRDLSQTYSTKGGKFKFVKEAFGYW
ncbi:hypothetical protein BSKO_07381 [Bryopsis sp. KO-2023]|nr:hypothetical protein BSKO_07381 [Bryopsis sp. KO-2023]